LQPLSGSVASVVLVVGTVVVLLVTGLHPLDAQASQQLGTLPTQAEPPAGAVHRDGSRRVVHRCAPLAFVLQQVTYPGLPQVDFE
jgi:hypothetical protein